MIFSAGETGRSAGYDDAFVGAWAFFGERRSFQVEVDVVGDEEIEMAVFVVVDPGAAGVPARFGAGLEQAGAFGDVGEGAVAVVVIENILAVVGDEEIVIAIVVVVADAAGLSPTGADVEAGTFGDIGEGAVAIVLEQAAMRLLALRETFKAPAVDEERDRASRRCRSRRRPDRSRWFRADICFCRRRRRWFRRRGRSL